MGLMKYILTVCCFNFSNFEYCMCRMFIHFVFTSNCFRVYSSYHLEPLFTEHVISMATASKIIIKHKLLSAQKKLDTKLVGAT